MKKTRYFKLYTGYADAKAEWQMYFDLARAWTTLQLREVRVFRAGVVDVYVTIVADWWWTLADDNDESPSRDAQDILEGQRKHRLTCRALSRPSRPELRWKGQWHKFVTAAELDTFAQQSLARRGKAPVR